MKIRTQLAPPDSCSIPSRVFHFWGLSLRIDLVEQLPRFYGIAQKLLYLFSSCRLNPHLHYRDAN